MSGWRLFFGACRDSSALWGWGEVRVLSPSRLGLSRPHYFSRFPSPPPPTRDLLSPDPLLPGKGAGVAGLGLHRGWELPLRPGGSKVQTRGSEAQTSRPPLQPTGLLQPRQLTAKTGFGGSALTAPLPPSGDFSFWLPFLPFLPLSPHSLRPVLLILEVLFAPSCNPGDVTPQNLNYLT